MSLYEGDRLVCRYGCPIHTCIPDGHLPRVTYAICRIDTIDSPDDEHMVTRNMQSIEINIYGKKTVRQVGYLQELASKNFTVLPCMLVILNPLFVPTNAHTNYSKIVELLKLLKLRYLLQHVSVYINHHQGAHSLCFAKVTILISVYKCR